MSSLDSFVDVTFPLSGTRVPIDHGYALFGALCRVLGDLHGADWLMVHPLSGSPMPDDTLQLTPQSALTLRLPAARIPSVLALSGSALTLDRDRVQVGAPTVRPLTPSPTLTSRIVTIKTCLDERPFLDAVRRQLDALGARATPTLGARRVIRIAGYTVVGFGLTLHGLSEEHSLRALHAGLGGRRRFGCGAFSGANV